MTKKRFAKPLSAAPKSTFSKANLALNIFATIASAAWIGLVVYFFFGVDYFHAIRTLPPADILSLLTGLCIPLIFIWMIVLFLDRRASFRTEAEALRSYIKEVTFPDHEIVLYQENISEILAQQLIEFRKIFEKMVEGSLVIKEDLKERTKEVARLLKTFETTTKISIREIATDTKALIETSKIATENAKDTSEVLRWQITSLASASEQSIQAVDAIKGQLSADTEALITMTKTLSQHNAALDKTKNALFEQSASLEKTMLSAAELSDTMTDYAKELRAVSNDLTETFRSQGAVIDKETEKALTRIAMVQKEMSTKGDLILKQSATSQENMSRWIEQLSLISKEASSKISSFDTAFKAAAEELKKSVQPFSSAVSSLREDTSSLTADLNQIIRTTQMEGDTFKEHVDKIVKQVENLHGLMQKQNEEIEISSTLLESHAEHAEVYLKKQTNTLKAMKSDLTDIDAHLEKQSDAMDVISDNFTKNSSSISALVQLSREKIGDLSKIMDQTMHSVEKEAKISLKNIDKDTTETLNSVTQSLKSQANTFKELEDTVYVNVENMGQLISELSKTFEKLIETSLKKLSAGSQGLRETFAHVSDRSEEAVEVLSDLKKQSTEAIVKLGSLTDMVKDHVKGMEKSESTLVKKLEKQIADLEVANKHADSLIAQIKTETPEKALKIAENLTQSLEETAVDLYKLIDTKEEKDLWKKYYAGDTTAFMKYLLKMLTKKQVKDLRTLFETDGEKRAKAQLFMKDFEKMLKNFSKSEHKAMIENTIYTSDTGKLYWILKAILQDV